MRKKLFITMLLIMSIFLSGSAYEKASNKYAKESKHIMLIAHGYDSKNAKDYDNDIVISIIDFRTQKWLITIAIETDDIVNCSFTLTGAIKSNVGLSFSGTAINTDTGEEMNVDIESFDTNTYITFSNPNFGKKVNMTYDTFFVGTLDPETQILFHDLRSIFDLNDSNWKEGTTKQLKMCLSENPYLQKI